MTGWKDSLTQEERSALERAELPGRIAPMLATLTHDRFSRQGWIFERKFDGERILAFREGGRVRLMTRNGRDVSETYPEIAAALEDQACGDFLADGEAVAFEGEVTSFSKLQQRMQIRNEQEARNSPVPVWYYAFDLLHLEGYALENLPLRVRKKLLKEALSFGGRVRYTPHRDREGEAYYQEACGKGWEGIVAKDAGSKYEHRRSRSWLKFKCTKGQELVIGGYTAPGGERDYFGALLAGYYEEDKLRYAGRVGTGFDEDDLRRLYSMLKDRETPESPFADQVPGSGVTWVKPELVAEIGFTEWTRAGRLRHPRFLGLRRDKAAEEVVREPQ
ncbi:MAG: non-homologous end-joining DNA ligase [Alphaproteobacteria bacterium]